MSELAAAMGFLSSRFSTSIHEITWKCPAQGKFEIVGSVPATCCGEDGRSRMFDTEQEALEAILADPWIQENPDQLIQLADCSHYQR